ncbi:alpha-defensin 1-like [Myotis daubentonii]|uniref:alpha-defensin 1-like n=1 Tax=Myotis daubentonii TaxID=98922 RepID=UPI002873F1E9|nr:alpha-defensin 1-like [Myotis daubentonii]
MRSLTLLAALLLLALQAQAQTVKETDDQLPAQDQPEAKDQGELWSEDEDQAEDGEQDVAISFTGAERLARAAGFEIKSNCKCRRTRFCKFRERHSGGCMILGHSYRLCCK